MLSLFSNILAFYPCYARKGGQAAAYISASLCFFLCLVHCFTFSHFVLISCCRSFVLSRCFSLTVSLSFLSIYFGLSLCLSVLFLFVVFILLSVFLDRSVHLYVGLYGTLSFFLSGSFYFFFSLSLAFFVSFLLSYCTYVWLCLSVGISYFLYVFRSCISLYFFF